MRDRAGRIRALALALVLALGLLPSAVLAQSAVDGGQAESVADTQDAVVEAVAGADQTDTADGEDPPDVVPAEDEDIVADNDATEEAEASADDISESAAEPVGDGAVQSAEEPAAEPEAPSDGEPIPYSPSSICVEDRGPLGWGADGHERRGGHDDPRIAGSRAHAHCQTR